MADADPEKVYDDGSWCVSGDVEQGRRLSGACFDPRTGESGAGDACGEVVTGSPTGEQPTGARIWGSVVAEVSTGEVRDRLGAALEVSRSGAAGDLGTPVLSLRDPHADGRYRHPCRPRSRPGIVRQNAPHGPPLRHAGRFPPLRSLSTPTHSGAARSTGSPATSTRAGSHARTHAS